MKAEILHVDMDAFYASVEQLDHPELRGRPVIVGAAPGMRGVVSACSYEARVFGVRSAMPISEAARRCPDGVFLPVRMERYRELSRRVMAVFESITPLVEPLSIDEAFLDVSGAVRLMGEPPAIARRIKERIRGEVGLPCSVGVATNKFLAKLAGDLGKPDGLTLVPADPAGILEFLRPLPVGRLWGVGPVAAEKLKAAGLALIGDLQNASLVTLCSLLGQSLGLHVRQLSRGIDERRVETTREEKSISSEYTFDTDCADRAVIEDMLIRHVEEVARRLREARRKARTVQLKLRFSDFTTISRQSALLHATDVTDTLLAETLSLLARHLPARPVRLVGMGVANLVAEAPPAPMQLSLFNEEGEPATAPPDEGKKARLDVAVDALRRKYGGESIHRATHLPTHRDPP
jgi:DNA polymerase-4